MTFHHSSSILSKLAAVMGAGTLAAFVAIPALAQEKPEATVDSSDVSVEAVEPETNTDEIAANEESTIADIATSSESLTTLAAALEAADLADTLAGEGPYTVFAPSDEAFAALPDGVVDALLAPENRDLLIQVLTYHVVPEEVTSDQLATGPVPTVEGSPIQVEVGDSGVMINQASVIQPDIMASNGVVHVIDQIILPPELTQAPVESAPPQTTTPDAMEEMPSMPPGSMEEMPDMQPTP